MTEDSMVQVHNLSHRYGERLALNDVSFTVSPGEVFALLGPNGSGKTTLFQILSTMIPVPSQGKVLVLNRDLAVSAHPIRALVGVVFQSNSLDFELTVFENVRHQGYLYGLHGGDLHQRIQEVLDLLGLSDRRDELTGKLSGGLRRRLEIAKALIHRPPLLLLDELSTGLDPVVRNEMWSHLSLLRSRDGVTILVTTHILEEADHCDRLGILDYGSLVAMDTPERLKSSIGGEVIMVRSGNPEMLRSCIQERFGESPVVLEGTVRIERPDGHQFIPLLVKAFPDLVESVLLSHPTLEDVFIARTGHRFQGADSQ